MIEYAELRITFHQFDELGFSFTHYSGIEIPEIPDPPPTSGYMLDQLSKVGWRVVGTYDLVGRSQTIQVLLLQRNHPVSIDYETALKMAIEAWSASPYGGTHTDHPEDIGGVR